ncbi:MAG: HAD-IC family P-type ATPase [Clostridia bacterium]|nr:HAD-IC family P-type ATPase [Clostridia bacterium]
MRRKLRTKKKKQNLQEFPIVRYQTDKDHGLSEEQVSERIEHKLVNDTKIKTSNSYFSIFVKNICTIFNLIWFVIAVALMCVNAWGDLLFLFVVGANTAISIFQEIKAKKTVEKLSMVTTPRIKVIRSGLQLEIKSEDLLLDDIIVLENGNQIPADCIIVDGTVEANESLLTGESNSIKKQVGDTLLAGSFLVSGLCYARVERVGKDNYIQTVAERTKDFKPQTSNLFKDLNSLIKIIILILIPIGVLTYCKEIFMPGATIESSITSTSGALTGMIPAGMYLLITVGLSVGVIKLGRKKTLVKNLYSIEMLARANVLCLDKTGTITDGTMNVVEVSPQNGTDNEKIEKIMRVILANQKTTNATSVALTGHFGKDITETVKETVEFSSQRKFSATTFKNGKTYYLGAVGFIKCATTAAQKKEMTALMEKGLRVIALVEDSTAYSEKTAGKNGKLLALFALEDHIRKDAVETIAWFKQNNVEVKIISGDDAITVSKIAKRVGVEHSDKFISLENMSLQEVAQIATKFTVFGRVTPEQKHTIIKTLKTQGNVVAMTGDGVNDTLALKEANCSIAMADGSEVARNISHLVLMESNFSALPSVVKEGRQIVNNVQNSSVIYLMKTLFTILLCATTLILRISYPFTPKQLLLLEMFVIGLPSFILTFQPNNELIRGNFIPQVLKKSIPSALLMYFNVLIVLILNDRTATLTAGEFTSLCTMLLTFVGYINLVWVCWPLNWLRLGCISLSAVLIVAALAGLSRFFSITDFTFPVITTLITLLLCTIIVVVGVYYLKEWYSRRQTAKGVPIEKQKTIMQAISGKFMWKKKNKVKIENSDKTSATNELSPESELSQQMEQMTIDSIVNAEPAKTATIEAESAYKPVEKKVSRKTKAKKA